MSEILSNIVVEQTSINFSPDNNNINITPEAIQLNIFTGASPGAGYSSNGELLYNNTNLIDGVPNTSFSSGNLSLGNIANVKISGGSNNYALLTDGTGNLSFAIPPIAGNATGLNAASPANVYIGGGVNGYVLQTDGAGNLDWTAMTGGGGNGSPGGSNTQIQYNDSGVFGGASGFTFNEVSGNVAIPGALAVTGTISGTLSTAAQPNITSVGTLNGLSVTGNGVSTTQIRTTATKVALGLDAGLSGQGNNAVAVGADSGYTNQGANTVAVGFRAGYDTQGANSVAIGTFAGNFFQHGNTIVLNATGAALNTSGTDRLYAKPVRNNQTANALYYDVSSGEISYGIINATTANTVTDNAQPNITSVGTLTSLAVSGNIIAGNANLGNTGTANFFTGTLTTAAQPNITSVGNLTSLNVVGNITVTSGRYVGNGSGLTNIAGANVTGTVANATFATSAGSATTATSATTAGTVTTNAQSNITSVGTLTSLTVSGNLSAGNITGNLNASNLTTGTVPNDRMSGSYTGITRVGVLDYVMENGQDNVTLAAFPSVYTWDVANLGTFLNAVNNDLTGNFLLEFVVPAGMGIGDSINLTLLTKNGSGNTFGHRLPATLSGLVESADFPTGAASVQVIYKPNIAANTAVTGSNIDLYDFTIQRTANSGLNKTYLFIGQQTSLL